jgi:hypothetical protein
LQGNSCGKCPFSVKEEDVVFTGLINKEMFMAFHRVVGSVLIELQKLKFSCYFSSLLSYSSSSVVY